MRAAWLDPPDRALIDQVYSQHVSTRVIATALGVSTRSVQRRVRRLARRLTDPTVVRLIRRQADWPRPIAQVAIDFYVRGRSLRRIAARRGLTLHQTRRRLEQARALLHATPAD
jgi:DNA-directed RNA polymerase specialized sigma24 family protein